MFTYQNNVVDFLGILTKTSHKNFQTEHIVINDQKKMIQNICL